MLRKKTRLVGNSVALSTEAGGSEQVRRAADRVFTRRKGLLARLAEGPPGLNPDPSASTHTAKSLVRKK